MYDHVLRTAQVLSHATALASKIDATGETPRSLAKTFSRVRVYATAVRYDINTFWYGFPDVGAYRSAFQRLRPPFYTPRARVNYLLPKRHLRVDFFLPYALYGWGHQEPVTLTSARSKRRKAGLVVTGRAYGASRFGFYYIRTYLYARRLRKHLAGKRRFQQRFRPRHRRPYLHMPRRLLSRVRPFARALRLQAWQARGFSAIPFILTSARRLLQLNRLVLTNLVQFGFNRRFARFLRRPRIAPITPLATAMAVRLTSGLFQLSTLRACQWRVSLLTVPKFDVLAFEPLGSGSICPVWRALSASVFLEQPGARRFDDVWMCHFFPVLSSFRTVYGYSLRGPVWQFAKRSTGLVNLVTAIAQPWTPLAKFNTFNFWRASFPRSDIISAVFSAEADELRVSVLELFMNRFEKRFQRRLNRACMLLPALLALRVVPLRTSPANALFNFSLYPLVYKHRTPGRFRHAGVRYKYRALRVR